MKPPFLPPLLAFHYALIFAVALVAAVVIPFVPASIRLPLFNGIGVGVLGVFVVITVFAVVRLLRLCARARAGRLTGSGWAAEESRRTVIRASYLLAILGLSLLVATPAFSQYLCPDGSYVGQGPCRLCPDGSYVSASSECRLTPKGTYVPARPGGPRLAPDGSYVPGGGPTIMCPDGRYVSGTRCVLAPDGTYVGE